LADCFRFTPLRYSDSAYSILHQNLEIIREHFNNYPNEIAEVHFIVAICYDWGNQKDKSGLIYTVNTILTWSEDINTWEIYLDGIVEISVPVNQAPAGITREKESTACREHFLTPAVPLR
jgi:hypothetical protein